MMMHDDDQPNPTRPPLVQGTRFAWVKLTKAWVYTTAHSDRAPSAEAIRLSWSSDGTKYVDSNPQCKMTVYLPSADRSATGNYTGDPKGKVGDRYLCFHNVDSGRWEVLSADPNTLRLFELTTAFNYGDRNTSPTASAKQLYADAASAYRLTARGTAETIYFPLAPRGSDGKYLGVPVGGIGMRVWCSKWDGQWGIVQDEEITAIAELTTTWTYPGTNRVPYTTAAKLGYYTDTGGTITWAAGTAKIFNPLAPRNENGTYVEIPHGYQGERYKVRYDPSSRLWEVTAQNTYTAIAEIQTPWTYESGSEPQSVPRAQAMLFYYDRTDSKLKSTYQQAYVGLAIAPLVAAKTAYVKVPIGRSFERVMVQYDPSSQVWFVVGVVTGMTYRATLYDTFGPGQTGIAVISAGSSSVNVYAKDCVLGTGETLAAETEVVISWCEAEGIFLIVAAKCPEE